MVVFTGMPIRKEHYSLQAVGTGTLCLPGRICNVWAIHYTAQVLLAHGIIACHNFIECIRNEIPRDASLLVLFTCF